MGPTTHYHKSSTIRVIQIEKPRKSIRPRNPRNVHSSEDCRQTAKDVWLKIEKGSRDRQAMQGESFQIKYSSLPHLIHCTNSVSRINDKVTLEQYLHTLYPTLPPPAKQWWDKYLWKDQHPPSGRQECHLSSYI